MLVNPAIALILIIGVITTSIWMLGTTIPAILTPVVIPHPILLQSSPQSVDFTPCTEIYVDFKGRMIPAYNNRG